MSWTTYKGLDIPDSPTGDAGINLTDDLKLLADRASGTAGSVVFYGSDGFPAQDNSNFFYDDTNNRLGIGTGSPGTTLQVNAATPQVRLQDTSGRVLTITGPTMNHASIALGGSGADLQIATQTGSGGKITLHTSNVTRAEVGNANTVTTLKVNGSVGTALASKNSNYTLTADDSVILVDASGGARTMTLPTAVGCAGREYRIKKIDSSGNAVTIATTSSQTIDGSATQSLAAQWDRITVVSDGSNWLVF